MSYVGEFHIDYFATEWTISFVKLIENLTSKMGKFNSEKFGKRKHWSSSVCILSYVGEFHIDYCATEWTISFVKLIENITSKMGKFKSEKFGKRKYWSSSASRSIYFQKRERTSSNSRSSFSCFLKNDLILWRRKF